MADKYVDSVWSLAIGIRIKWTNSMEELLAYTHLICLFNSFFFLALNFLFSKTKMFKYRYLFSQAKYYLTRESWMVIIQIETLHTLSILISACIYFCELKKRILRVLIFYEWQVFDNFEFINFSPIEKWIRKIQLN